MLIRERHEYMSKPKPLTMTPETKVADAVKLMDEKNYGSVIITNHDGSVQGIVTERDLLRRLLARGRDQHETTLGEIMTKDVRVAQADDDLLEWLRLMSNERFRHLPIVDEQGKVVSMMSQGDFVSYTWPDLMDRIKETTQATLGPNYQLLLIIGGVIVYALLLPVVFGVLRLI